MPDKIDVVAALEMLQAANFLTWPLIGPVRRYSPTHEEQDPVCLPAMRRDVAEMDRAVPIVPAVEHIC